jgi:alkanesulfonate monooxygenase SsuD/methylene tetrahydromethanopterin reductase-like flavin-dependent oxidoreductase (luciferase family)
VSGLRDELQQAGRAPDAAKVFAMFTVIVDASASRAQERLAALRERADLDGARALLSGWTGIDLSRYRPDDSLAYVDTDAGQSALASFSSLDPGRTWTVRDAIDFVALGGRGAVVAGNPQQVADQLQLWVADTGIDGFNLAYVESPRTFIDVADLLVPELQRRGAYKTRYAEGTLREKLLGRGPHLAAGHPGHALRVRG